MRHYNLIENYGRIGGQVSSFWQVWSLFIRHPSWQMQVWIMIPSTNGISQTPPSTQNIENGSVCSWLQVDPTSPTHDSRAGSYTCISSWVKIVLAIDNKKCEDLKFEVLYLVVGNRMCMLYRYTLKMCQRCNPKSIRMLHHNLSSTYCACSLWSRVHSYTDCPRIADFQ